MGRAHRSCDAGWAALKWKVLRNSQQSFLQQLSNGELAVSSLKCFVSVWMSTSRWREQKHQQSQRSCLIEDLWSSICFRFHLPWWGKIKAADGQTTSHNNVFETYFIYSLKAFWRQTCSQQVWMEHVAPSLLKPSLKTIFWVVLKQTSSLRNASDT